MPTALLKKPMIRSRRQAGRYLLLDLVAQGDPLDPKSEQDQDFISFDFIRRHTIGTMLGSAVVPGL